MKNIHTKGFIIPTIFIIIALLAISGAVYVTTVDSDRDPNFRVGTSSNTQIEASSTVQSTSTVSLNNKTSSTTKSSITSTGNVTVKLTQIGPSSGTALLSGPRTIYYGQQVTIDWDTENYERASGKKGEYRVVLVDEISCSPCPAGATDCVCTGSGKKYIVAGPTSVSQATFTLGSSVPPGAYTIMISIDKGDTFIIQSSEKIVVGSASVQNKTNSEITTGGPVIPLCNIIVLDEQGRATEKPGPCY